MPASVLSTTPSRGFDVRPAGAPTLGRDASRSPDPVLVLALPAERERRALAAARHIPAAPCLVRPLARRKYERIRPCASSPASSPPATSTLGNYSGGFRQYVATQEQGEAFFCIVDLHSITVEYDAGRAARVDALARGDALRDRARPGPLDGLRRRATSPAHAEAAWLLGSVTSYGELRRMTQFKDKVGRPGVRLRRALHLPGADGRRHPALPDRHRPDRRRPAAAPRARARRRRALQRALRRDVQGPARRLSRGSGARIMDLQEPSG